MLHVAHRQSGAFETLENAVSFLLYAQIAVYSQYRFRWNGIECKAGGQGGRDEEREIESNICSAFASYIMPSIIYYLHIEETFSIRSIVLCRAMGMNPLSVRRCLHMLLPHTSIYCTDNLRIKINGQVFRSVFFL